MSHYDADGISSGAILSFLLSKLNRKYVLSIVTQLTKQKIKELANEPYEYFIFADLGSSVIESIGNTFDWRKKILILDHHETDSTKQFSNIIHVNPHLCGINGGEEISGSGVSYLFAREIDESIDEFSYLALVGMLGDLQHNSIDSLNDYIVDLALKSGKVERKKGLKLFGAQTKPLYKALEHSTDPYIPYVTGSESGAIQFLLELGINPKNERGWRRLVDLSEEEIKKLVAGIVIKRQSEENPEDILGDIFILKDAPIESPFKDLREFATLLNACGRMEKGYIGICACLNPNSERHKKEALSVLESYRKELVKGLKRIEEGIGLIKNERFAIIDGGEVISPSIIGVITSIMSKSIFKKDDFVMGLANTEDGFVKISLRKSVRKNADLRLILSRIVDLVGDGEVGGHEGAAGALIPAEEKERFIEPTSRIFPSTIINLL